MFSTMVPIDIRTSLPFLMRLQIVSALWTVERDPAYRMVAGFVSDTILELDLAGIEKRLLLATTSSP